MYLTASEYATLTGNNSSEATTERIYIACKMLDSRIGNYGVNTTTGWKIDDSNTTWYLNQNIVVTQDQKQAVQLWVSGMIKHLTDQGSNLSTSGDSVKLGRFSVAKSKNNGNKILPDTMNYHDSILISSGIINRNVSLSVRGDERDDHYSV